MENREINDVLAEIFTQKPLPNRLKVPKQQWLAGKLGLTGSARIIEEYSDWQVEAVCIKK